MKCLHPAISRAESRTVINIEWDEKGDRER